MGEQRLHVRRGNHSGEVSLACGNVRRSVCVVGTALENAWMCWHLREHTYLIAEQHNACYAARRAQAALQLLRVPRHAS